MKNSGLLPLVDDSELEGGTGLGLSVAERIAGSGGERTFGSDLVRGTTATLWLPLPERT